MREVPRAGGVGVGIDIRGLERLLKEVEPRVILVTPRIVRRVIKHDRRMTVAGLQVPHHKSYVVEGKVAAEVVDPHELGVWPGDSLPETLILIARPEPEELASRSLEATLIEYWRLLFHARVHVDLDRRLATSRPNPAALRERIERIGRVEFEEARTVLRQENYLLPPRDDWTVYVEFAAVYLELRHFADARLPRYFPTIRDLERIDDCLARDIDAEEILRATCLAGLTDPVLTADEPDEGREWEPESDEDEAPARSASAYHRLIRGADDASRRGNVVRAAILRMRAVRVAPHGTIKRTEAGAREELNRLALRLREALDLDDDEAERWRKALVPLLERSARGVWAVEARLLFDFQKICVDHEREIFAVDLVEWALSLGRRPIKRLLPNQREVLISKHLRSASRRLTSARLDDWDRNRLSTFLRGAIERAGENVRERLRPLIGQTFEETRIQPRDLPERVALNKLTEELLDRIVERGFLRMGDLRDALSRSNLKLPDLAGPAEFVRGDRLLRTDRRFAIVLDGVYHRGEIYLRWLQKFSSLAFGTRPGRFLTRFVALPFGGAFVALSGLHHILKLVGFDGPDDIKLVNPGTVLVLGLFLLGLIDFPGFRATFLAWTRSMLRFVRWLIVEVPGWLLRRPIVQAILTSRPLSRAWRWLLKPMVVTAPAWFLLWRSHGDPRTTLPVVAAIFAAVNLFVNSRLGRDVEEWVVDRAAWGWHFLRSGILPGLFRLVMEVSARVLEGLDRLLYSVDEWLRFRGGQGRLSLAGKAVLGLGWFFVTYVVRFCVNLLIEPQLNPIKHFPVVTVSHKMLITAYEPFYRMISPHFDSETALAITGTFFLLLPGVFGFLVWELKENWRLYEANRPATLKPIVIGHHGETMARFLRPGFHSGTLPKLFAKLRRDDRTGSRAGRKRKAMRKHVESLHHVEEAIRRFSERELVALLDESTFLRDLEIKAGEVAAGSNRIAIELRAEGLDGPNSWIAFEEESGWLIASLIEPGWVADLAEDQRRALATTVAGLYKMAGVDLIREQVRACFEPASPTFEVEHDRLLVWPRPGSESPVVYSLQGGPELASDPQGSDGLGLPTLDARRLLYQNVPITWRRWVEVWDDDRDGVPHPETLAEGVRLLPPAPAPKG